MQHLLNVTYIVNALASLLVMVENWLEVWYVALVLMLNIYMYYMQFILEGLPFEIVYGNCIFK
jgi:hypothetical protein